MKKVREVKLYILVMSLNLILNANIGCHSKGGSHSTLKTKLAAQTWTQKEELPELESNPTLMGNLTKKEKVEDSVNGDFFVETRTNLLTHKNCLGCHEEGTLKAVGGKDFDSHWDIAKSFKHAGPKVMNCKTCHNSSDVNQLRLNNGEGVSLNHPYQLCSQCHFNQEKDWRAGAHGKRMNSWYGDRTVKNCTSCHNPHKPAFEKRLPKTFNKNLEHFSGAHYE